MKKDNRSLTDDDVEKLLTHYHQHIKHQSNTIDDTQMRQQIIAMATEHSVKQTKKTKDSEKLKVVNTPILKQKQLNKADVKSKKTTIAILPYHWSKVASWLLAVSGVLLTTVLVIKRTALHADQQAITTHSTTVMIDDHRQGKGNPSVSHKPLTASVIKDSKISNSDSKKEITKDTSPIIEEISLEELLSGEIVVAQIEPNKGSEDHGTQAASTINKDEHNDFQHTDHRPSIKIAIEQAPVLPAGSMSDPDQISLDNSI